MGHMCTKFGVGCSSRFPFSMQKHTQRPTYRQTHKVREAADYHTHASAIPPMWLTRVSAFGLSEVCREGDKVAGRY